MPKTLKELGGLKASIQGLKKSDLFKLHGGDASGSKGGTDAGGIRSGMSSGVCICGCSTSKSNDISAN
ncbi:MAG: hypothetical protein GY765_13065 [bacterium]|nr:hypothetical protein [bacterium]